MNRILLLVLSSFITACGNPPIAHSKSSAPVAIEYFVPKNISSGSYVSTVIRFVAKTDLQKLVVSAAPYSGMELISGGDSVEFADLQNSGAQEVEVNIRLTDEVGYLSVFATTTDIRGRTQSKSITIRYGEVGESTIQKMRSQGVIESPTGEKLIMMPGEARN